MLYEVITLSHRPRPDPSKWAEYGERVTQVAEHLLSRGVRMAFHHHMGGRPEKTHPFEKTQKKRRVTQWR